MSARTVSQRITEDLSLQAEIERMLAHLSEPQCERVLQQVDTYRRGWAFGEVPESPKLLLRAVQEAVDSTTAPGDAHEEEPERAPPAEPPKPAPIIEVLTTPELLDLEIPDTVWMIDKLLPEGGVGMLSGWTGAWKSWFLHHAAVALADGGKFMLAYQCRQGRVLMVQSDGEPLAEHRRKFTWTLEGWGLSAADRRALEIRHIVRPLMLSDEQSLAELIRLVADFKPDVVLVDSLRMTFEGDENDSSFAAVVRHAFGRIQAAHLCSVLVVHHTRKDSQVAALNNPGQRIRGSGALRAILDTHMAIDRRAADVGTFTHEKSRSSLEVPPFNFRFEASQGRASFENLGAIADPTAATGATKAVLDLLSSGPGLTMFRKDLVQLLKPDWNEDQVDRALAGLRKAKKVTKGERAEGTPYTLVLDEIGVEA